MVTNKSLLNAEKGETEMQQKHLDRTVINFPFRLLLHLLVRFYPSARLVIFILFFKRFLPKITKARIGEDLERGKRSRLLVTKKNSFKQRKKSARSLNRTKMAETCNETGHGSSLLL